jgi:RES domain-containing protein
LTITSWRVVTRRFKEKAFDGEGARIAGGRWNSIGIPVVYTAATTSLGLLELLVHSPGMRLFPSYVAIPVLFGEQVVEIFEHVRLPEDWRRHPSPGGMQKIGDEWAASQQSCILRVPSAVVPHEWNYLLNPKHPDFNTLGIGDPIKLDTDQRLHSKE